jgi:hypothetical protein
MYQCQLCRKVVPPNTKAHHLIVESRFKRYPPRPKANHFTDQKKSQWRDDPGGEGCEIVREILVCPDCAARQRDG